MVYPVSQRELSIHLDDGRWAVRPIDEQKSGILGPVDYGCHRFNEYPDSFTFGEGLLAGPLLGDPGRHVGPGHFVPDFLLHVAQGVKRGEIQVPPIHKRPE